MVPVSQGCLRPKGFGRGEVYRRFGALSQGVHWGHLALEQGSDALETCLKGRVGGGKGVAWGKGEGGD